MKICHFLLLQLLCSISLAAQQTLIDTFPFEATTNFNSFWGITDVDGQLHLGADGNGDIYVIDENATILSTINVDDAINFNHGMVWDGSSYWVAEDFTTGGASLFQLDATGTVLSSFVLPPVIGGNSSGVGGLSLDGDNIWYTIYYPDFDTYPYGYAYNINPTTQEITDTIPLYGKQVYGIAVHGDVIFYVTDDLDDDEERIYAYSKTEQDTLFSFPLLDPDGDSSPRGLHWFDDHLWLLAKRPGGAAFAFTMLYKYAIDLGEPLLPEMSLSTESLDFGTVIITENKSLDFKIKNEGNAPLDVSSFESDNNVFTINSAQTPPFTIVPGDSVIVTVLFTPDAAQNYSGIATVSSNANMTPTQTITLLGVGEMVISNKDIEKKGMLRVFPNPVRDYLQVEYHPLKATKIRICLSDSNGKIIQELFTSDLLINQQHFAFDISQFGEGTYFLTLQEEGKLTQCLPIVLTR